MRYSVQDYADMLRGYLDSKCRVKPVESGAYLDGWSQGYRRQSKYQRGLVKEMIA